MYIVAGPYLLQATSSGGHSSLVPRPSFPQRWMYYITSMRKEGLENIARFSCATGMHTESHDTRPHGILISDELTSVRFVKQ